jgi:hypothetical protein
MSKELLIRDEDASGDARPITTSSFCASNACVGFREGLKPETGDIVDHFNGNAVDSLTFPVNAIREFIEAVRNDSLQPAPVA